MARERKIGLFEPLCHHGTKFRIFRCRTRRAATANQIISQPMIVKIRADAADQGHVMHLLSGPGEQFRDANSRDGSGYRTERPTRLGICLGVPGFKLADAAIQVHDDDGSAVSGDFAGSERVREQAAAGNQRPTRQKLAHELSPTTTVIAGSTGPAGNFSHDAFQSHSH